MPFGVGQIVLPTAPLQLSQRLVFALPINPAFAIAGTIAMVALVYGLIWEAGS